MLLNRFDAHCERLGRRLARGHSRRGFLARFGQLLVGGSLLPLLPVARAAAPARAGAG